MFGHANKFAPLIFKPGITPQTAEPQREWSSLGQAGSAIVFAAVALIQYAAITGPVLVPPTAETPLTWQAEYPDQVRIATFPTANQQAFVSGFQPIIPTFWQPRYPDRAPGSVFPTSQQQALASGFVPIVPAPSVTSWEPNYPDRPTSSVLPAATSNQAYAAGFPPIIPSITSWEPTAPDRNEPPARTAQYQAWAGPVAPIAVPAPLLSWAPRYPDRVEASTYPTSEQRAYTSGFVPIIPPITSWKATAPDRNEPAARTAQYQAWAGPIVPIPAPAPLLSWAPRYPDRLDSATYPTAEQRAFASGFAPIIPTSSSWAGGYASIVPRVAQRATWTQFYAGPVVTPTATVPLSWLASYPSQHFRAFSEASFAPSLIVMGPNQVYASVDLPGFGSVAASAMVEVYATGSITGDGSLSASGQVIVPGSGVSGEIPTWFSNFD